VIVSSRFVPAGAPCVSPGLAHEFCASAPELMWYRSEADACAAIQASITANDRYEFTVWDGIKLIGVAIVVPDQDDHVGVCLSVQWRFVATTHRGLAGYKMQRAILQFARANGWPVLAYTKRVGNARYELRYIRVGDTHGQEGKEDFQEG
jgi:hypothetical protein